jgi:carboxyl-terminal processing protease
MQGRRFDKNSKSCSRDVAKLLREMREKDVDGIVLDLRNNGGGSLFEAVQMTGLFIKTGPTVQVREARRISILPDRNPTIAYSGPLVVLVNRLSASASEILAAALQDYGRAVIVGDTKTHGKGSVQTILRMGRDKSMGKFKVTNALFYRISGGSTQLRGVKPDIVVSSAFDFMEFGEDFLPNPMEWSTIKTAIYSPFGDLSSIIPQLTELSQKRKETEASFIAYNNLLKRIESANAEESLSLNIETRRTKAKAEKELLDIQNKLMEQDKEDDDNDIVETEALRILVDLIRITNRDKKELTRAEHQPAESSK